ncbi:MAG: hypothetical protein JWM33_659, partial [Caulobacteraceae bacterium]|nr:hypothetical protein [Caulobacteraceae bacterium]
MPHNRSILMAVVTALTLPMLSPAPVGAAPAQTMINGKPCTPVPGGSAKLGIQLFSLPGLLQGTATSIDEANNAAIAAAATRAAQGGAGRGGAPGAGGAAGAGGRGGAPGAG